jgi:hypothetical protein
MSIKAIDWAFRVQASTLSSADAFVLVALADNSDDRGLAYPSIETISRKTKHDRKTVERALHRLEKSGFIQDSGQRVGRTKSVKVFRLKWADERTEANPNLGQLSNTENGVASVPSDPTSYPKNGVSKLPQKRGIEPSYITKEPKKRNQLSKFIEFLIEDPRFDGLDVEDEVARAVEWCEKKNKALTERFLESWLLHAEQPLEKDEEEVGALACEPYYSWEGWTQERRRALLELWPGAAQPPQRWDKLSADIKEMIETRVKEGWG